MSCTDLQIHIYSYRISQANTFINKNEVITVPADIKKKSIHHSLITDISRDLIYADLISSNTDRQCDEKITINTNDNCMCELNLLNCESILSIFDTGSTVNLISEDVVKTNEYLSTLPIQYISVHSSEFKTPVML